MATVLEATSTTQYPIWIGEDDRLYCDQSKLEYFLIQVLGNKKDDATRLLQEINCVILLSESNAKSALISHFFEKQTEIITIFLKSIEHTQLLSLLSYKDEDEWTVLHYCVLGGRHDVMKVILDSVSEDMCYQLLQGVTEPWLLCITDDWGRTPLHWACEGGYGQLVRVILERVREDKCYQLLCITDVWGRTPLHWACEGGYGQLVRVILERVREDKCYQLLCIIDVWGYTPLHKACMRGEGQLVRVILERVSEDKTRYQLLCITDDWGRTPLHRACGGGNGQAVREILEHVNLEMKYSLLQMTNDSRETPLHLAAYKEQNDVMRNIHKSVSEEQWISLLQMKEYRDLTVLQAAAYRDKEDTMITIRCTVTNYVWLELLTAPLPELNNPDINCETYQRTIDKFRPAARIQKALHTDDKKDQELQIQNITETESLTVDQIKELSPLSSRYVIPHKQKKSKRYGLILFSSDRRPGAAEEADNLDHRLKEAGCDVMKMEWSKANELHNMIDSALERINADCSLLIVCLMAHGSRGTIHGGAGEAVPVNSVLHQFNYRLSEYVPMVILMQACQVADRTRVSPAATSSTQDPAPTQLSDSQKDQHITLTRPHTVLLLSTVRGGVAYRGVFTGAMANQFRYSDGETDIYTMFNRAVGQMQREYPEVTAVQVPMMQVTTNKVLILPPADQDITSQQEPL